MSAPARREARAAAAPTEATPFLAHHFPSMTAQAETSKLGLWLFLGSEVLFFSGLFTAYGVFRANHFALFHYAHHFLDWRMGALNTVVLITSSLTAAWSVRSAQLGDRRGLGRNLALTLLLAGAFLVVKYFEYRHKLHNGIAWGAACHPSEEILASLPPAARALPVPRDLGVFFSIYYLMTGLHGIHVLVGMGLYVWLLSRAGRGHFGPAYYVPVDSVALYWHLVDMIWIFLFPLFYLIG
jgi:cytochrome c oxidase subunit 3